MDIPRKESCFKCGRRGKRWCSALEVSLCPQCCAARRGVEIECSADCSFSPFAVAGYDLWLKLDDRITPKLLKRVVEEVGADHLKNVADKFIAAMGDELIDPGFAFNLAVHKCLLVERDESGKTVADRWELKDWTGLRGDEALMMRYRRKSFVTVIEIQKTLDHQTLECVDLLAEDPRPFVLIDRSMAARSVRFTRLLIWLTHYPHFSRPGGIGYEIPDIIRNEFMDLVGEMSGKRGKGFKESAAKAWLAENLSELIPRLFEWPREKMQTLFRSMDSHQCVATYLFDRDRETIARVLEEKPDFDWDDREPEDEDPPGTDYYRWLRAGESREIEKRMHPAFRHESDSEGVGILGNLKLREDCLIFEAFSKQKYQFGKKMLKKYFGETLSFQKEKIVDIARQVADEIENRDWPERQPEREKPRPDSIPPEIKARIIKEHHLRFYRRFLDEGVPALNGLTPRAAAKNARTRGMLLELMKRHLHGLETRNREDGLDLNIDFVLRELGLDELL